MNVTQKLYQILEVDSATPGECETPPDQVDDSISLPLPSLADLDGDYVPAIKMRVAGLTEYSSGNGRFRNTVEHACMIKSLAQRKLVRQPHQILCDGSSIKLAGAKKLWGIHACVDRAVSCPKCQRLIESYNLVACQDSRVENLVTLY